MANTLELNHVTRRFDQFVLDDITFSLPEGYIAGLIGPNGSGKTTTIRLILNMLNLHAGSISVFGLDHQKAEAQIKQKIGVVMDSVMYPDTWTLQDTERGLKLFYPNWDNQRFAELTAQFGLPAGKKIKDFSKGMQMKLMLASAFSHHAELLILDEPTSGLDPVTRDELLDILLSFIDNGKNSVLFSTHITSDLEKVADYIMVINHGKQFFAGTKDDLLEQYVLVKGKNQQWNEQLGREILGMRKSAFGFEGLMKRQNAISAGLVLDKPTLDDIVIYTGRKENEQ